MAVLPSKIDKIAKMDDRIMIVQPKNRYGHTTYREQVSIFSNNCYNGYSYYDNHG